MPPSTVFFDKAWTDAAEGSLHGRASAAQPSTADGEQADLLARPAHRRLAAHINAKAPGKMEH